MLSSEAIAAGSLTGLFYILLILARTVGPLKWLGNLSIFHYYEPATSIALRGSRKMQEKSSE